jgi:hypothetical protein
MSGKTPKERFLNELEVLKLAYRKKSEALISCASLAEEMQTKEVMACQEIEMKILKRQLARLELENTSKA